ncbi:hypothetical protein B4144_0250 [Bacillus atrophaeus]|nr:hypothetical protein B4144_0250 [Bacillus atrophaeus]
MQSAHIEKNQKDRRNFGLTSINSRSIINFTNKERNNNLEEE